MEFSAKQAMKVIVVLCCAFGVFSVSQSMSKDNNNKIMDEVDKAWHPGEDKNLINPSNINIFVGGQNEPDTVTFDAENNRFICKKENGTFNQMAFVFVMSLPKGTYTINRKVICDDVPIIIPYRIEVRNNEDNSIINWGKAGNPTTFTLEEEIEVRFHCGHFTSEKVYNMIIYDLQLEVGDIATDYEPYKPPILK